MVEAAKARESERRLIRDETDRVDIDSVSHLGLGTQRFWGHVPDVDPVFEAVSNLYWFHLVRGDSGVAYVPHAIDDQSGVGTQVVAGDINGDSRADIVISNKKGAFVFLQVDEPDDGGS